MKKAEAAAAKAAYESSRIIEEAMAQAATIRRQSEQEAQAKVGSAAIVPPTIVQNQKPCISHQRCLMQSQHLIVMLVGSIGNWHLQAEEPRRLVVEHHEAWLTAELRWISKYVAV